MSSQYKENKFSTESFPTSHVRSQDNIDKTARPNIDVLIKRILTERRRERKKTILTLGAIFLSIILFFIFISS